jgi:hypothetical protein
VFATWIALLQCCVTTFIQASQHCSVFYQYFYLATTLQTDTKLKTEIACICCSRLKSNASLLHHLIEISDLYQTGEGVQDDYMRSQTARYFVYKCSLSPFWCLGHVLNKVSQWIRTCSITVLRRWRETFSNIRYTTTCFIKPQDGIEKISRNVASFQKSYNIRYTYWYTCEWKLVNVFVWNTNDVGLFGT